MSVATAFLTGQAHFSQGCLAHSLSPSRSCLVHTLLDIDCVHRLVHATCVCCIRLVTLPVGDFVVQCKFEHCGKAHEVSLPVFLSLPSLHPFSSLPYDFLLPFTPLPLSFPSPSPLCFAPLFLPLLRIPPLSFLRSSSPLLMMLPPTLRPLVRMLLTYIRGSLGSRLTSLPCRARSRLSSSNIVSHIFL